MKKIILIIAVLGLLGGAYAYYQYNRKPTPTNKLKADYRLNSEDLLSSYQENEQESDTKYLNKILEVTGTVGKITNENGLASIYLKSDEPLSGVIAEMASTEDISALQSGNKVVLKGRCTGMLMDVVLVNCVEIKK